MTKSLADLLANKWDEPAEMKIIKDYVRRHYKAEVGVKLEDKSIIINVPNAALAGALRPNLRQLQEEIGTDKRLIVRIG